MGGYAFGVLRVICNMDDFRIDLSIKAITEGFSKKYISICIVKKLSLHVPACGSIRKSRLIAGKEYPRRSQRGIFSVRDVGKHMYLKAPSDMLLKRFFRFSKGSHRTPHRLCERHFEVGKRRRPQRILITSLCGGSPNSRYIPLRLNCVGPRSRDGQTRAGGILAS